MFSPRINYPNKTKKLKIKTKIPTTRKMIHTFIDKSVLVKVKAKELVGIPVWRGNRFLDIAHAEKIKESIGHKIELLDKAIYSVVTYKEGDKTQRYLVDGQHRQYVLRKYFEENIILPYNFPLLVIEKAVEDEAEAIEYFNIINNTKPQYEDDKKLLANKYIAALMKKFPKLIRPEGKATKRPFLSSDLLRKVLEENSALLKQSNDIITNFVENVNIWNTKKITEYEIGSVIVTNKDKSVLESSLDKRFVLAFDAKLPWVKDCLV